MSIDKIQGHKKYFEANLLDGDKVENCGGAMIRADEVWEVAKEMFTQAEARGRESMVKDVGEYLQHKHDCLICRADRCEPAPVGTYDEIKCTCGLSDLLTKLKAVPHD